MSGQFELDSKEVALRARDVVVEYKRKHMPSVRALAGMSLDVLRGQVHGLVGESGCGKSTLGRAATGLVGITSGSIDFEGKPVKPLGLRPRPRHFRRLQMIFQDAHASLNPRRTVGDQLADALRRSQDTPSPDRDRRILVALERVGLPEAATKRYPSDFSGGQRQRICVARSLVADPTVIIADEPISALDASAQAQISNLLAELARDLGIGILFISHDLAIVRQVADVVTVMYLGKVVESASTDQLWAQPLHPYSQALIAAAPAHDGLGTLPEALAGDIPDPAIPPTGCRFHPRCKHAFERCPVEEPALLDVGERRRCACWLQAEKSWAGGESPQAPGGGSGGLVS